MKTKEILDRLKEATEIVSAFPPDVDILTVLIDGLTYFPGEREAEKGRVQIRNSMQKLTGSSDRYMGFPVSKKQNDTFTSERILMDGFEVFDIVDSVIVEKPS